MSSIQVNGLLQPIAVFQPDSTVDAFVLIAGERRWRAYSELATSSSDYARIPATVIAIHDDNPDTSLLLRALTENVTREDLSPADRAAAVARLRDLTGWTYDAMATHLGMTVQRVHALSVIGKNEPVRQALSDGKVTQAEAIEIARVTSDPDAVTELIESKAQPQRPKPVVAQQDARGHVAVKFLPIWRLMRQETVPRTELCDAIVETCKKLGWWPTK